MTVNQHSEDLKHIRNLMEKSSKFNGLSGWSIVAAGMIALTGMAVAHFVLLPGSPAENGMGAYSAMILLAAAVLVSAIGLACFFMLRKTKKAGQVFWSLSARRALLGFAIPFITGGIFCLALLINNHIQYIAAATLIFYGLALVNAAKFTIKEVYYLGLCEIITGLAAAFFFHHSLLLWGLGFGLANLIAGLSIYFNYDRK